MLLPGKSHGGRSLVGCSPWGSEESDTTERLHFHFSLSCIGEGNGNPPQCSCLENSRDGGAWWAAVYGVAQSWTRLKRLSNRSRCCCLRAFFSAYIFLKHIWSQILDWRQKVSQGSAEHLLSRSETDPSETTDILANVVDICCIFDTSIQLPYC